MWLSTGDVFPLGSDGGGNIYLLLTSGNVAVWNHEEENIEDHTQFASLDIALWCLLRLEAVNDKKIDRAEFKLLLAELGDGGPAFLLKTEFD